jgi:uncharacterized protein
MGWIFALCYTYSMDIQTITTLATPILKRYGVKKAALFGSIVRGDATEDSDIDILIDPPEKFSFFDLAGLQVDLEETLKKSVDVVEYDGIKPILRKNILAYEHPIL